MENDIIKMSDSTQIDESKEALVPISEFIAKYKNRASDKSKDLYLKSIVKEEYVPYLIKQFWARQIIEGANFDKEGNIHFDQIKQYMSYMYTVLSLYTKLDVSSNGFNIQFDTLNENGVIKRLEENLPEDFKEFQSVYKMVEDDFRTNYAVTHINTDEIGKQVEIGLLNGVNKVMDLILKTMQDEKVMAELQKALSQNQE